MLAAAQADESTNFGCGIWVESYHVEVQLAHNELVAMFLCEHTKDLEVNLFSQYDVGQ